MKLKKLFKDIKLAQIKGAKDPEITGVCSNSKLLAPGNLFIAKKGMVDDGAGYINEAVAAGAAAVLTDMYDPSLRNIVQIIHPNPAQVEGIIAASFYKNPSDELFVVGITGTNGKTTTSFLIKYLLDYVDDEYKPNHSGLIGTIEYIIGQHRYQAIRTTPDVLSNQKMLREMCNQGCKAAVLEVTSHALDQARVSNIQFDVAVFTNLTLDHLDYHGTMETYCSTKNKLFRSLSAKQSAIVNADSSWTQEMIKGCSAKLYTYGIECEADFRAIKIHLTPEGTAFTLVYQDQEFSVEIPLVGRFNVYNCLAAIAASFVRADRLEKILPRLSACPSIPGRLEPVKNALGLKIYVDFAHSGDALKNVLECLQELKTGKIITVFGCGGDRDRLKRPVMAEVAMSYSDLCIVTSDNPRSENPESICREIIAGFKKSKEYLVEIDRRKAILTAIERACPNDIILIAGKGHETTQVFAHKTIEFDDRKVAAQLCEKVSLNTPVEWATQ